jgi:glycosyltransferase involved in cell wall biosynthesis
MAIPRVADFPRCFVSDGRPGAERRRTIDDAVLTSRPEQPLVTITTVVYNNALNIERAMQSVFAQTYRNIEYIVVDGGSTDATVDAIARHGDRLSYWHSARDGGISDAFNKGIALARGDLIGLVNSDDWMSADQVEQAIATLAATGAPFVFGDLVYYDHDSGAPQYRIAGDPDYAGKLWHRMPQFTHPTAIVRRQVYEDYGLFDPRWKIGMDYDWLQRLNRAGLHGAHSPTVLGHMSLGGVSDVRNAATLREHLAIARQYGSSAPVLCMLYAVRRTKRVARQMLAYFLPAHMVLSLRKVSNRSLQDI